MEEGQTVVIEDAATSTYNGSTQIVIDPDVSKVHQMPEDENQQTMDSASTDGASQPTSQPATDGGQQADQDENQDSAYEQTDDNTRPDIAGIDVPRDADGTLENARRIAHRARDRAQIQNQN